jgi:predicted alpha/beta-hydrolase family hydrolase
MPDKPEDSLHRLIDGPSQAVRTLILAHGAGQGMDSPFMEHIAGALARAGLRVVRFAFPYMTEMRRTGKRKPPNREPVLRATWNRIIDREIADGADPSALLIGGKSMGGRMASLIADEREVGGLVCLGYPFHPPGKPDRLRTEHLRDLRTPALICQGERDSFGRPEEVAGYSLSPAVRLAWIEDGDHSFKPRKRSGRTWEQNLEQAAQAVADFAASLDGKPDGRSDRAPIDW